MLVVTRVSTQSPPPNLGHVISRFELQSGTWSLIRIFRQLKRLSFAFGESVLPHQRVPSLKQRMPGIDARYSTQGQL